jgi:mRNA interferase MazF
MYKKGTVVLIPFPFTDLSANKVRPALIISSNKLKGDDIVAVFISSNTKKSSQPTDCVLKTSEADFEFSGLKTDSIIKIDKIATLDKKIILGELGSISSKKINEVDRKIKILFNL